MAKDAVDPGKQLIESLSKKGKDGKVTIRLPSDAKIENGVITLKDSRVVTVSEIAAHHGVELKPENVVIKQSRAKASFGVAKRTIKSEDHVGAAPAAKDEKPADGKEAAPEGGEKAEAKAGEFEVKELDGGKKTRVSGELSVGSGEGAVKMKVRLVAEGKVDPALLKQMNEKLANPAGIIPEGAAAKLAKGEKLTGEEAKAVDEAVAKWAQSFLKEKGVAISGEGEKALFAIERGFRISGNNLGYNFNSEMHGMGKVAMRGVGTALGAVMAIDAIGRGKKGDGEDRGWVGRVAEGAAGVGMAAASALGSGRVHI